MRLMKEFLEWYEEVRELARHRLEELSWSFSFERAYAAGYSPRRAVEEAEAAGALLAA